MSKFRSLKKRRRFQLVGIALGAVGVILLLLFLLPETAFQYYRSPTEITQTPPDARENFRMGGLVAEGSIVRGEGETISFVVTDLEANVNVVYTGILPDLFDENQGVVALGRYENGVFMAREIEAKHDENYMPKEVADSLKQRGVDLSTSVEHGGS